MARIAPTCSANPRASSRRVGIVSIMTKWTAADVPDQSGRVAVVTGSNTGIGYEAAAVLAAKGAHVVLAVRNLDKGKDAAARIAAKSPTADVTLQQLDLTSLDDRSARPSDDLRASYPRIDLLINNAGVMYTPKETTKDGFELQFGTNHLGHFALTGPTARQHAAGRGFPGGDGQQLRSPDIWPESISTICNGNTATTASRPTGRPSWPTCCSPTSWGAG